MTDRGCRFLKKVLVGLLLMAAPCAAMSQTDDAPLYIIERDTLQTRNFVAIVNHETMAVNLGEANLELDLTSPIPAGKNHSGPFYPAFLEDSLLPDPLFAPLEVAPTKVSYLDRPQQIDTDKTLSFIWPQVALPPGEAVIAQYDNFLGEKNFYHRPTGLDIFGLEIATDYRAVKQDKDRWQLTLAYTLSNDTDADLSNLVLDIFVPLIQHTGNEEDKQENVLMTPEEICSSPDLEVARMTRVDGFSTAATGLAALLRLKNLEAGQQHSCFIRVVGLLESQTGTLWPILSLRGRSLQQAIWPPTQIEPKPATKESRFSYLSYNLVLQDSRVFTLSPEGFQVNTTPPEYP
jgi:hypothetical protein